MWLSVVFGFPHIVLRVLNIPPAIAFCKFNTLYYLIRILPITETKNSSQHSFKQILVSVYSPVGSSGSESSSELLRLRPRRRRNDGFSSSSSRLPLTTLSPFSSSV